MDENIKKASGGADWRSSILLLCFRHLTPHLHHSVYPSELERLKRENGSHKDVEKSEVRFKKAKEEYKMFVEKYAIVREDFNRKMVESSLRFQGSFADI